MADHMIFAVHLHEANLQGCIAGTSVWGGDGEHTGSSIADRLCAERE